MKRSKAPILRWWLLAAVTFAVALGAVELNYRLLPPSERHYVDHKVRRLAALHDTSFRAVVLGDSVVRNVVEELELQDAVLDLTTNASTSIAGNYFLLRRLLRNGNTVQTVLLFVTPTLLEDDLRTGMTPAYFSSVFVQPEEVQDIRALDRPDVFHAQDWGHRRRLALRRRLATAYAPPPRRPLDRTADTREADLTDALKARIDKREDDSYILGSIARHFLVRMHDLCVQSNATLHVFLEPMPIRLHPLYWDTAQRQDMSTLLTEKAISFVDVNASLAFPDEAFSDGHHLKPGWRRYWAQWMNERYRLFVSAPSEPGVLGVSEASPDN